LSKLEDLAAHMDSVGWPNAAAEIREADERIKQLQSEVERLMLVWSDEKPKVPGRYFMRMKDAGGDGVLYHITQADVDHSNHFWFARREWAGPIPAPLEPKEVDHA
jgi:hypothetical protein